MRQKEIDDCPKTQSISKYRLHGWDAKRAKGPEASLKRFLDSKVGLFWDEIYSELCKKKDKYCLPCYSLDYCLGWHIDTPLSYTESGEPIGVAHKYFYIDQYGFLRKFVRKYARKKLDKDVWRVTIGGTTYAKKDGLWYRVTLDKLPEEKWGWKQKVYYISPKGKEYKLFRQVNISEYRFDVFFEMNIRAGDSNCPNWGNKVYCTFFNSCNSKDIKKIKTFLEEKYERYGKY